jgi:pimeloyl-ACP methyl ester carboxylesterase
MLAVSAAAMALLSSCSLLLQTKPTLDLTQSRTTCDKTPKVLIVMLPGRFDSPDDLVKHGFVDAVRKRGINADIVIPDLHFGYYIARTAVDRLHEDVILKARQGEYTKIWLAGISVGGLGSLLYAQYHPDTVDGIMLMAPFLGERGIHEEIARARGLRGWEPGETQPDDYERRLWTWLKEYGNKAAQSGAAAPRVYLGYGRSDRFASSNQLLADVLPKDRVTTVEGGHEWRPWLKIWEDFLDKESFPNTCVAQNTGANPK